MLIEILHQECWAIIKDRLDAIQFGLAQYLKNGGGDLDAIDAKLVRPSDETTDVTLTDEGIAIIPIKGVLVKRLGFFSRMFGANSFQTIMRNFEEAIESQDVKAILLDIDSPGGTVAGTEALADLIYQSRGKKPIIAFANGLMASAAYWVGSAADVILTEETGEVGSIGVVMVHYDFSKEDERYGLKRTLIYAGKYKTAGNDAEPLSEEAKDYLQEGVDYMYTIFIDSVARNRDVEPDAVLQNMADGRIFIGQKAVDAGLVDQLGSFEEALELALSATDGITIKRLGASSPETGGNDMLKNTKAWWEDEKFTKGTPPTIEQLSNVYPDLVDQIKQQGADSVNVQDAEQNAAQAERERIFDLLNVQLGDEAGEKFRKVVESGVTLDQFKAIHETQPDAPTDKMQQMLEAIIQAGADNPGAGDLPQPGDGKDFMSLVEAYQKEKGCNKTTAIQVVMGQNPKAHQDWVMSQQKDASTVH